MKVSMNTDGCLAYLRRVGLLMNADTRLPSVTTLVAGEAVRGSWWAHPLANTIFLTLQELAAHPDLLLSKLIGGKDTFVHRRLWPEIAAIGLSGESWQTLGLPREANALLAQVNKLGNLDTKGILARLLESRMLVHGAQFHGEEGHHRKRLETWQEWAARVDQPLDDLPSPGEARRTLEQIWPEAKWPWLIAGKRKFD